MQMYIQSHFFSECRTFTISRTFNSHVMNTAYSTAYLELGECMYWCFDVEGCYTFFHDEDTNMCKLYVSCGSDCNIVSTVLYNTYTVYVRTCIEGKNNPLVLLLGGI